MINIQKRFATLLCVVLIFSFCSTASADTPIAAEAIILNEVLPMLENDTQALLLFAAELNISNGPPDTRDFGERGMFGKLVNAEYVMVHYGDLESQKDAIQEEVRRLLFGPWRNGGKTTFSFATKRDARVLNYATGKWNEAKEVLCIRIEHATEMSNKTRVAYIACGDMGYGIVKKKGW